MVEVVVIAGRAGSGKSTLAKWLHGTHGAHIRSSAGPLKDIARDVHDFTDAQLFGTQVEKETEDERIGMSPRRFLQLLGSAVRTHLGHDVWTRACVESIRSSHYFRDGEVFVVDDARYPNEVAMFKAMASADVRVTTVKLVKTGFVRPRSEHDSESSVDAIECDYTIQVPPNPPADFVMRAFVNQVPGPWSTHRRCVHCWMGTAPCRTCVNGL